NLSPNRLSLLTALCLSVPLGIAFFIVSDNVFIGATALITTLACSYFLIRFVLESFIYRKIKLIYKFIYQTKASKKEEMYYKYILPQKSIDEVREDVEAWAQQRSREIDLLKKNEIFRKEFLQNLSHEFKTPVFAIQGYVDTLLDGALENPEINKRFLEKASKNVERLVNLIKDLDEISRLERGELKLKKENFIIQDLVKEVFEHLSWKAEERNISFSIKKGCEQPLMVHADREKIRQVIGNLADNSIKYGKIGGSIVASMYNTDDKNILVELSDDGIGINEKN